MILSDVTLIKRLEEQKDLVVRPLGDGAIRSSSIDLRLGRGLLIALRSGFIEYDLINSGPLQLERGDFVLGSTIENIEVPTDLVGVLVGKSTRARQGLQVESAGYVDPGWKGELTLEIVKLSPLDVVLTHGMWIAQIRFEMMTTFAARPYNHRALLSRYQGSKGPVPARE